MKEEISTSPLFKDDVRVITIGDESPSLQNEPEEFKPH